MYLDEIASAIREHIPEDCFPDGDPHELLRLYAVLLRAKGSSVTQSDVHDAWAAWMAERKPEHKSLVPYEDLGEDLQDEDRVFAVAIRRASDLLGESQPSQHGFKEILFPFGIPKTEHASRQSFDLYKVMVESSERLVSRRQGVNTFFLTINGALLTASGLIVQSSGSPSLGAAGILVLATVGGVLCLAWKSLITSFGQLNTGKFKVINTIERYLDVAIYAAEWEALGRGKDPNIYRSFTSREMWVPWALLVIHAITAVCAIAVILGWLALP